MSKNHLNKEKSINFLTVLFHTANGEYQINIVVEFKSRILFIHIHSPSNHTKIFNNIFIARKN